MLHAGLDLSRGKLDVCLLSDQGEHLDQLVAPPDADGLRRLARRIEEVHAEPVRAAIESMTGARFVHDTLEQAGWAVEIADAERVKAGVQRLDPGDQQPGLVSGSRPTTARPKSSWLNAGSSRRLLGWLSAGNRERAECVVAEG
jgi:hypothetical protein